MWGHQLFLQLLKMCFRSSWFFFEKQYEGPPTTSHNVAFHSTNSFHKTNFFLHPLARKDFTSQIGCIFRKSSWGLFRFNKFCCKFLAVLIYIVVSQLRTATLDRKSDIWPPSDIWSEWCQDKKTIRGGHLGNLWKFIHFVRYRLPLVCSLLANLHSLKKQLSKQKTAIFRTGEYWLQN